MMKYVNEEELRTIGAAFGRHMGAGSVIALTGDLGAGKTTFAKSVAAGLGYEGSVTSPTFTIIHEYEGGRLPMYHFDVYRLKSSAEFEALGADDYLFGDGICVVEWADLMREYMPYDALWIELRHEPQCEDKRQISLSGVAADEAMLILRDAGAI